MNQRIYKYEMPALTLTDEELEEIARESIGNYNGSFDFNGIVSETGRRIYNNGNGFIKESYTEYKAQLQRNDVGRIREIIWDL